MLIIVFRTRSCEVFTRRHGRLVLPAHQFRILAVDLGARVTFRVAFCPLLLETRLPLPDAFEHRQASWWLTRSVGHAILLVLAERVGARLPLGPPRDFAQTNLAVIARPWCWICLVFAQKTANISFQHPPFEAAPLFPAAGVDWYLAHTGTGRDGSRNWNWNCHWLILEVQLK